MSYEVLLKPAAERQLRKLEKQLQKRITGKLIQLQDNPRGAGAIKLSGSGKTWRIRVGDYRIVYEIDDSAAMLFVTIIAHRREVYRDL